MSRRHGARARCSPSRRGRSSGAGARRRGVRPRARAGLARCDRAPQSEAERVRRPVRRAGAGRGRRRGCRRSAAPVRRAGRHQGPAVGHGGPPDDGGQRRVRRLGRRPRQRACAEASRGRSDRRRQDEHAGGRHAAGDREQPVRRHPQSVGSRALGRRVVGRQRLRRRVGNGGARRRQRPRRLDPDPGRLLRPGRPEAQPGARLDRPRLRRPRLGDARRLRAHPDGHGHGRGARRHRRRRAG